MNMMMLLTIEPYNKMAYISSRKQTESCNFCSVYKSSNCHVFYAGYCNYEIKLSFLLVNMFFAVLNLPVTL